MVKRVCAILIVLFIIMCPWICAEGLGQSAEEADFRVESVEEVETQIKTFENGEVIIQAQLPPDMEIRVAPTNEKYFYDVWFVKDGDRVDFNALVKVEFKSLGAGEGRIVKLLDNGSVDVTSDEEGTLKSVWFEVN